MDVNKCSDELLTEQFCFLVVHWNIQRVQKMKRRRSKKGKNYHYALQTDQSFSVYKIYKLITNHFNTYVITVNTRKEANTFGKYIHLFILFYGFFFY